MDQSEEAAFTIVENWWKKSFDISKNANDPLFSLYTKSFETIMVYMSQSLDYEYIEREISSLDKGRQLALQSENGYDAHRCLSFGLIEAVQMMMKKNTKKIEEMIKQGYIPVPEIPKFPVEPKEEEVMDDRAPILAENEISSLSLPQEITEQPIYDFSQDFPADDQTSPLASIEQDFHLKEEEMMDDDVNNGMDDFTPEIGKSLNESPLEDEILDEPDGTIHEENDPFSEVNDSTDKQEIMNEDDDSSSNQTLKEGRKSTRRISDSVKYNSMEDSEEEEVEPTMKKTRLDSAEKRKKAGKVSSEVKCVLCETYPKTTYGYVNHLHYMHKSTLIANGIYLLCSCGFKVRSDRGGWTHSKECDGLRFTLHKLENDDHVTPQCILCEAYPKTAHGYAKHLANKHKSTLNVNDRYLLCSCGVKVRSTKSGTKHEKECDSLRFTLHEDEDKDNSTPQCIFCETYPKTANCFATHLRNVHKSTLVANEIYLLCSCGFKVCSVNGGLKHAKECDERAFSLHNFIEE